MLYTNIVFDIYKISQKFIGQTIFFFFGGGGGRGVGGGGGWGGGWMEWEWRGGEVGTEDCWLDDLFASGSLCFGSNAGRELCCML